MRICIVGAGAMGGLYGGAMAESGADVTLLDIRQDHVDQINRDGLHIPGLPGARQGGWPATTDPAAVGKADLVFVQTDINATRAAAESAKAVLADDGCAITLQNGIGNVEILAEVLGAERVLAGVSYHSAALTGLGATRHSSHSLEAITWVGELDGRRSQRVDMVAAAITGGRLNGQVTDNIVGVLWGKLIHNCALNPICAITGLRMGQMARLEETDLMQTKILEEAVAVAKAKNITLAPHPDPFAYLKDYCRLKYTQPSMQQHMESGRQTEIDAINGAIVREADALGMAAPYNHAISMLIKGRETHMIASTHDTAPDWAALEAAARGEAAGG
ncbi:MAG: 2-dehydropantoate 2-reductase [Pseudomonadota bacterium]|nr:2-dehydropantoate 2-reductase [Pseudomonadota bacterium]